MVLRSWFLVGRRAKHERSLRDVKFRVISIRGLKPTANIISRYATLGRSSLIPNRSSAALAAQPQRAYQLKLQLPRSGYHSSEIRHQPAQG